MASGVNILQGDVSLLSAQIQSSNIYNLQKDFLVKSFDSTKTIVFTWTQDVKNRSYLTGKFWGFGDILRGMISLYQYCKARRLSFKVDISHHPLARYFDVTPSYNITLPLNNTNFYGAGGGYYHSLSVPEEDNCQVFTNVWPQAPFTNDEVSFIPTILKVKDEFKLSLPTTYIAYHLRFDDEDIMCNELTPIMNEMLECVVSLISSNDILCTNIPLIKKIAKDKYGIKTYNDDVTGSHIGYEKDSAVHESMITDYQILANASVIYTYSSYIWVSGFVQWVANAYNRPLIDMKSGFRIC